MSMRVVGKNAEPQKNSKGGLIVVLPDPPKYWDLIMKKNYKEVGALLIEAELLKAKHIPTLKILAGELAQLEHAEKAIIEKNKKEKMSGYIQKFTTGASNIAPEVSLKEKAIKQIFICLKRFGLDPKSEKDLRDTNQLSIPFSLGDLLDKKAGSR